ncbi:siphovirus Gp157 family protein [Mitsuokella sp. AF21-1AC]|uniref:siphovirus Gp157 family protein n=1 Tax=Mitsuokella sp. AF21-1AC TaxID=2292235 RepID=UPI000E5168D1|nr:siphovirus Gp157 family protein [Mitsuokella sp. AF21-1AC]RGS72034.1 hypothetical protein DWX75_07500 [Mitsuokella sp. AF21-1AC]
MNLYEIDREIESCVDMETGETIDTERLASLQMEKSKKIENIGCWIKNLTAEAAALKNEKDALAQREKVAKNKADGLKQYLAGYLAGQKFKTAKVAISYRKSEAVEIADEAAVPDEYRIPQPDKIDKTGIKKALKDGAVIVGAQIVERQNIQIK